MKDICYVDGYATENFELSFEDAEDDTATLFSVYEREKDGCLRWIADFGNRAEAERWAEAAARYGLRGEKADMRRIP
jgi:hypothetical protein